MTIRTLLVPLDGSDDAKPAIELGLAVGRDLAAHVTVLHVRRDPKDTIPRLNVGMPESMIEDMIQIAEKDAGERAARERRMFDELIERFSLPLVDEPAASGASAAWSEEVGRADEVTVRRGRLADLFVVGRPTATSDVPLTLNAALFVTGRPVLVGPPGGTAELGRSIGISWNASAQATRAVGSALPLITQAEKVTVLTAASDKTSVERAPELATYLEWHGITPDTRTFAAAGRQSVGAALMEECGEAGVDLLVMGGYTHSRMRQLILGGVTRHVLEEAGIPLFMAH